MGMVESVGMMVLGLSSLAALLGVIYGLYTRGSARTAALLETNRALREQLADTTRHLHELGREQAASRAEAREEAERGRARVAQQQAEHMAALQRQVHDLVGLTHRQMEDVRQVMQERLQHLSGTVGEQLGSHGKVIMEVRGQLGGLAEAAQNMHALGKDISSLQDILRAPKLRGNLGELLLEEILRQVLPAGAYAMQHRLPGHEPGAYVTVDAVIRLNERLVPIDSKFPLESFKRLLEAPEEERGRGRRAFLEVVRRHIDVIADKYIRPDAGTYDFALVYLPAENVYYEAVVRDDAADGCRSIVEHAARRKVIPVSPNTFYAYLLTLAYGLKGMHIEQQAEAIRGQLAAFNKKFVTFFQVFEKVGRNLDLAQRGYEDAAKRAGRLNEQVGKITGAALDLEAQAQPVDGPAGRIHLVPVARED
ncbi:MAG TPA: DNA recombination protein RmuC [Myxococcota bacterium]|nr:DNA recombination protein RmuC [Myxococcota bacterium]